MSNADIVTPSWLIQQTCRLVRVRPGSTLWRSIAPALQPWTFLAMNPTMSTAHLVRDPRHTFLKPQEVIAMYRWGRTRGYLVLSLLSVASLAAAGPPDAPATQGRQAFGPRHPHQQRTHQRRRQEVARPVLRTHDGAPHGRVVYLSPATGKPTSFVPPAEETLDELFDRVERFLDQKVAMGTPVDKNGQPAPFRRDINQLSKMYLDYLRLRDRDKRYIDNRKSQLNKWILPAIGSVLVALARKCGQGPPRRDPGR